MSGWTDAEEVNVLQHYFAGGAAIAKPSTFVGLLTAPGNDDGTYTEIAYTGYARLEILAADWDPGVEGDPSYLQNANDLTFGEMTGGVGGTVTHFGLFTLVAAGVMLFHGSLVGSLNVVNGVIPQFAAGNLQARLGG